MRTVVAELSQRFDLVLIDSPPVLPVADAMILSSYVDGVLIVVSAGQTRRGELRRTAEKLAQAGGPVVGTVLNKAAAHEEYGYYGSYEPYVLPGNNAGVDGAAARNGRGRQNGTPLPSGQPGWHDN
jgi:Mrp family chromosome partitioning ATPase